MKEKGRGLLFPICQIPVCRFVRQHPQTWCSVDCRVGNRSSHRRSFRVRNDLPEWENTDRPAMRSALWNILAASSGRRGECGRPVTNQFEGTGVVLGAQLTQRNCEARRTFCLFYCVHLSNRFPIRSSTQSAMSCKCFFPSPVKSGYRNVGIV